MYSLSDCSDRQPGLEATVRSPAYGESGSVEVWLTKSP